MAKSTKTRVSVYQVITDRILTLLEAGTVPWHKPWKSEMGYPRNVISRKPYRGVNAFLLACMPYGSPFWLTYRQAQQLGGHVRKGEKSCPVVFWKWLEKDNLDTGKVERVPLLRYYSVFNAFQCELPDGKLPPLPEASPDNEFTPIDRCETMVAQWSDKPTVRHDSQQALYRPATDTVHMPRAERFDGAEEYYSALFHELTHATGHPSRLNRPGISELTGYGSRDYSKEELVAEMGAAFLCGHCAIENGTIDNSAAYVAGWLARLRKDNRLVVQAAAQAQKATDLILGRVWADETAEVAA